MKATHTPGPWHTKLHGVSSINGMRIVAPNGLLVASMPRKADRPLYTKEADARLIAAAPELLAACKAAFVALSMEPINAQLKAAILKAEGAE